MISLTQRHHKTSLFVVLIVVVLSQAVRGQSSSPVLPAGEDDAPINALCPVTSDEPIDPRFTVRYRGMVIGLCCRKCRTRFEADPEAYVANIPEFASSRSDIEPQREAGPDRQDDGHEHPGSDTRHADDTHLGSHSHGESANGSGHEGGGHDHALDHARPGPKLIAWLGKLHPPSTHLPIGMLIGAAMAEAGLMLTRREMFRHASAFCIGVAALGALAAMTLGWLNGGFVLIDDDWVQATHRWLGTLTAVLSVAALVTLLNASRGSAAPRSRGPLRLVLLMAVVVAGAAGFFGGALVYGLNHYAW